MSFRIYSGEYLIVPYPLHLDLNSCVNNCSYCFSRGRKFNFDYRKTFNQVLKRNKPGKSLEKWFLKEGFPVLISNTTDPFSDNNREITKSVVKFLYENGVPVCFQTKNRDDLLFEIKPTGLYISITTDNEKNRKYHEPKADSIEERIRFAKECFDYGHYVEIGINPFIPEWWNSPIKMIDRLISIGLKRFVLSTVHLSIHNEKDKRLGKAFIKRAMKRKKPEYKYVEQLTKYIEKQGGRVDHLTDHNLDSEDHNFKEYYIKTGHKWFPTIHEFFHVLNKKRKSSGKPIAFTIEDFTKWADVGINIECSTYKNYLNNWGRSLRNVGINVNPRSFHEVHKVLFNIKLLNTQFRSDNIYLPGFDYHNENVLIYDYSSQEIYRNDWIRWSDL